jgi:hypothetical protein
MKNTICGGFEKFTLAVVPRWFLLIDVRANVAVPEL